MARGKKRETPRSAPPEGAPSPGHPVILSPRHLRMIPLGVGDAFSAVYYSSCLALEAEGAWLLIDCPHPIRKVLREGGAAAGVPLDVDRFTAVVLTHLHADH